MLQHNMLRSMAYALPKAVTVGLVGFVSTIAALQASSNPDTASAFGLNEDVEALLPMINNVELDHVVTLPMNGMVAIQAEGEIFFISENGRYVIQGRAHDIWQGIALDNIDSIEQSATRLNLQRMGIDAQLLNTLVIGEGGPEENLTVFVDPYCEYCMPYVRDLKESEWDAAINVVIIPAFGETSHEAAYHFACRTEEVTDDEALEALLAMNVLSLPAETGCESVAYRSTLVLAESIGVNGVPFTIDGEGKVTRGVPVDLGYMLEASK